MKYKWDLNTNAEKKQIQIIYLQWNVKILVSRMAFRQAFDKKVSSVWYPEYWSGYFVSWILVRIFWCPEHWSGYVAVLNIGQDMLVSWTLVRIFCVLNIGQDILVSLILVRIFQDRFCMSKHLHICHSETRHYYFKEEGAKKETCKYYFRGGGVCQNLVSCISS